MKALLSCAFIFLIATFSDSAVAYNLWCRGSCVEAKHTIEFQRRAGDVDDAWSNVKQAWREANAHLGHGVVAEFENKLDNANALKDYEYRYVLRGYIQTRIALDELDYAIARLQAMDAICEKTREFEIVLAGLLATDEVIPKLSEANVRYAESAGLSADTISNNYGTAIIHAAWQSELEILKESMDELIMELRGTILLAEEGDVASMLLSGQNDFGEALLRHTQSISDFDRFYVRSVIATIRATFEVYPAGFGWLIR